MKVKSYGIATPSFNNLNKIYQLKAITTSKVKKVYGLKLNVVSPFIENIKDYPIKASPFARYKGVLDEEVDEVASRIRTVDSVLSKYYIGSGVREKGAIIQEVHSGARYIEHLSELVKDLPVNPFLDNGAYIVDDSIFIRDSEKHSSLSHLDKAFMGPSEYDVSVLEDESALKILRVLMGHQYIENLKSHKRRLDYKAVLLQGDVSSMVDIVYLLSMADDTPADYTNRLAYLPELISASRIMESPIVSLEDYELVDFLFLPHESRMFDIEFHERRAKEHHFAVVFNDYDTAIKPTVHESNMRHDYFELVDRVKLIRDVRFYDTEMGMRAKSLYGVDDVTIMPDTDEFLRVHLELDVNQLSYDLSMKPREVDSVFHDNYTYAEHNMTRVSSLDDGYDELRHNMTRDSIYDNGYEFVNHNMTRESTDDDGFDIMTRSKELESSFYEEFDDFELPEIHVYMNDFDLFDRRNDKVAYRPEVFDTINRREEVISTLDEQFSYGYRLEEWDTYHDFTDMSSRSDEFMSSVEIQTNIERSDIKESLLEELTNVRRYDEWLSSLEEYTNVDRADTWLSVALETSIFGRVDEHEGKDLFYYELSDRVVEIHDKHIIESVQASFDSVGKNIYIEEFTNFDYTDLGYDILIEQFQSVSLKDVIWDGGQYHESIEAGSDYVPSYMIDYELFERRDEHDVVQNDIDESSRVSIINDLVNYEFDLFTRIPVIASSPISSELSDRVDAFISDIHELQDSIRDKTFDSFVQLFDDLTLVERIWNTNIEEPWYASRVDVYGTWIEEFQETTRLDVFNSWIDTFQETVKVSDYISDIIEDITNYDAVYKETEIIEYFDFLRDMTYDTSIVDVSPVDAIKIIPETPVYETLIIELEDAFRRDEWQSSILETVLGYHGILGAYLPEFDLGRRLDEWKMDIEEYQSTDRVDVRDSVIEEYQSTERVVDLRNAEMDVYQSAERVDIQNAVMDLHQISHRDILLNADVVYNELFDRVDMQNVSIEYEQWSDIDRTFNAVEHYEQESDKVEVIYDTSINLFQDSTKFKDYTAHIIDFQESSKYQDYIAYILEQSLFKRDNTHMTVENEFDLFERVLLEGRIDETMDLFTRTILDIDIIPEFDRFNRTIVDITIGDIDWYTRTEVDVKLIVGDEFTRDAIYDASLEEFDEFDGQDWKDYTWLWHSRPYWWLKWNWAKTK